ncbi:hypothetical protein DLD77_05380 [Chitinophaga alhagiae]|uniref:Uncharacterized protein n=1 Tax=Chitinophaga alhagiae TaxID=2203219 RepID=A0ABN5LP29_9BACT|nr:hypothetical protein [Chitinophaga alhagiae]AWO01161.1 hypothetical protein DLD77_05380 [Chitinophaga alhagiae]
MKHFFALLTACLLMPAIAFCQALSAGTPILILQENEAAPTSAKHIGNIRIKDGGFKMRCGYEQTMEEARNKARSQGANIVKITQLKRPDALSTCYRLRADIYYQEDLPAMLEERRARQETALKAMLPDTASYSLLCVYRPKGGYGWAVGYNLHVNDSLVGRVENGCKFTIKLPHNGEIKIWARTEAREEVIVDVRPGQIYFLRCGVGMGALVGRPQLGFIRPEEGMEEFAAMPDPKE